MGGTRIFVLQMKQIRKFLLVAAVVLTAILILALLFGGRAEPRSDTPPTAPQPPAPIHQTPQRGAQADISTQFVPGTYQSEIPLSNSTIVVNVEVSESAILSVSLSEPYEAQAMFYPLMQPTMENIARQIVQTQSLNVQASGETPYTQEVLISAIRTALDTARAQ